MNSQDLFDLQQHYLIGTYSADLVLSRGCGARVWDVEGREYLDFTSGISVCNLGHCHPKVTEAIQRQAATLVHVSNLFINEYQPRLAAVISKNSFDGLVFFANSGAEANEGMIKFARKWGSSRGRHEIICMEHCFHGRTLATLAATDKPAIREGFGPFPDGFRFVPFNDIEALATAIGDKTAAVMLEPIQGEGGVLPAAPGYLPAVRKLCDEHGILMLFDEVQTAIGRAGSLFAYQLYDVVPDAMSLAKALGNGYPIGAFEIARKHADVLGKSAHASTFGGTPLACAAALATIETLLEEDICFNVQKMGQHLKGGLLKLAESSSAIRDVRGQGLMVGIQLETDVQVAEVLRVAREAGLLLLSAAGQVVRVYPPLTINKADLDEGLAILSRAIGGLS